MLLMKAKIPLPRRCTQCDVPNNFSKRRLPRTQVNQPYAGGKEFSGHSIERTARLSQGDLALVEDLLCTKYCAGPLHGSSVLSS